jgi:hypothetical protein
VWTMGRAQYQWCVAVAVCSGAGLVSRAGKPNDLWKLHG